MSLQDDYFDLDATLKAALIHAPKCNPQDPELVESDGDRCPREHRNCCGYCAVYYQIRDAINLAENVEVTS